ncbi:MAG: DUF1559 domain-containing protein [Verrucomicrobia bacterium]|nr:DUF1559 domain-containing protein [Verrucomicrobiota bacterium]
MNSSSAKGRFRPSERARQIAGHHSIIPLFHHSNIPSSHAFTLIELLVVIAIISLLAAMLMPALKNAKDSARAAKCQSNLHQIGLGMIMYANENDDGIPYSADWTSSGATWRNWGGSYRTTWKDLIVPYLGGPATYYGSGGISGIGTVWSCPSWSNNPSLDDKRSPPFHHYNINDWVGAVGAGLHQTPVKLSGITQPAASIFAADARGTDAALPQYDYNGLFPIGYAAGYPEPNARHNGGVNLIYFDGHAGFLKASDPQLQAAVADDKPWKLP